MRGIQPLGSALALPRPLTPPTKHQPAARLTPRSDGPTPRLRSYANVYSWYQPDTIVYTTIGGEAYLVMANEGDSKEEALRVKALKLDPTAFPNAAALQAVGHQRA